MDIIEILFFIPIFLFTGLIIGIMQLFSGFGLLYALPAIVSLVGTTIAHRCKKTRLMLQLVLTACMGQWFSFIAWIASWDAISAEEATRTWGLDMPSAEKAGFPFPALELPPSPMGGDYVPTDMWSGVFTNHLFWFLIAFGIAALIVYYKKLPKNRILLPLAILALLGLCYNLAMFALWFD